MESIEKLHMGKSRVSVIMTLLPFSHLERKKRCVVTVDIVHKGTSIVRAKFKHDALNMLMSGFDSTLIIKYLIRLN